MNPIILTIDLPNTLLFLRGDVRQGYPEIEQSGGIWATETCIAVSGLSDGPTRIVIGRLADVQPGERLVFDGEMSTAASFVSVEIVPGDRVDAFEVSRSRTHFRIWTDGYLDSEYITIAIVD